jgi:hypothetical protein
MREEDDRPPPVRARDSPQSRFYSRCPSRCFTAERGGNRSSFLGIATIDFRATDLDRSLSTPRTRLHRGRHFRPPMPVWSVFIAVALVLGFAVRLAIFWMAHDRAKDGTIHLTQCPRLYVIIICPVNCLSVFVQSGSESVTPPATSFWAGLVTVGSRGEGVLIVSLKCAPLAKSMPSRHFA